MIQHINKLYEVRGKQGVYEFEAIKHLPWITVRKAFAKPRGKEMRVYQADGSYKIAYLYGEKTWSYDKEEIENHRKACQEYRATAKARRELTEIVLTLCDTMSIEELENFVKEIEKRG